MSTHLFVAEWNRMSPTPTPEVVDTKRLLAVIFSAVAVLAGSRIAYLYIAQRRRRAREDRAAGRRERRARCCERDLSEAQLCVVCAGNPKEIILLPCGHVCLCEDCSNNIPEQCPICRERIESRALLYIY